MQKSLYALCLLLLPACHAPTEYSGKKESGTDRSPMAEAAIDTGMMVVTSPPEEAQIIPDTVHVGGYFNSDTSYDRGYGVFYGRVPGASATAGGGALTETQYIVRFQDNRIRPMPVVTGRHIRLVNEGDLNADGKDEISIFVQSMQACMYTASTWSYTRGRWIRITEYWNIPTACAYMSDEDLQNRIVLEDGVLYYYDTDTNDKDLPLVKKELILIR